ncbi:hypothetical protein [Ideonella sp.]|uniref:hypothetical protein n=1 Tax=Ideonella sp. TaxID=1929293 RepID=UPI003BB6C6D5
MLRIILTLLGLPILLAALLALVVAARHGALGAVSLETFELGIVPVVLAIALVMGLVFLPLLGLCSRWRPVSWWSSAVIGILSAFLPLLVAAWPLLADTSLRAGFRLARFADGYPWLALGAIGGLLFWGLALFRNPALGGRCRPCDQHF